MLYLVVEILRAQASIHHTESKCRWFTLSCLHLDQERMCAAVHSARSIVYMHLPLPGAAQVNLRWWGKGGGVGRKDERGGQVHRWG